MNKPTSPKHAGFFVRDGENFIDVWSDRGVVCNMYMPLFTIRGEPKYEEAMELANNIVAALRASSSIANGNGK